MKTEKNIAEAMEQAGEILIEAHLRAGLVDEKHEGNFVMNNGDTYRLKFKR